MNKYRIRKGIGHFWNEQWQLWEQYKYLEKGKWITSWHKTCQGTHDFVMNALRVRYKEEIEELKKGNEINVYS